MIHWPRWWLLLDWKELKLELKKTYEIRKTMIRRKLAAL
jgi:hypothetical protein